MISMEDDGVQAVELPATGTKGVWPPVRNVTDPFLEEERPVSGGSMLKASLLVSRCRKALLPSCSACAKQDRARF